MRRFRVATITGLVMMTMSGCAESTQAPTGDALYRQASKQYFPLAEDMHRVIMAIDESEWTVGEGGHGALGVSCQLDSGEAGYFLNYVRSIARDGLDAAAVSAAAADAFSELGITSEVAVLGNGDAEEHTVIGEDDRVGRAVVTIRPGQGEIRVTARTDCVPGDAHDLTEMVFGGELDPAAPQRLPAYESRETVPQFYFPADGPLYFGADGAPVEPQPVVTDPPEAPYGD